ncbi:type II secretion system protein GspD [Mucilaginibacter polytrichastri]|uniref:Type II/III secretion system secretin-like domain-containing protein n=1 Tax=Mucilaginibacter polytrichastri TaxID=1302689 RepID=A0A1Q5ZZU6_9SPHI|nr:general secretion pathway protein GspD [Mucilaginibacter polytrichastri]OKS87290.1 hypothetical protein RG47T_2749 [Mucilaginibacter polytrichastri]SFT18468.1 type II secretion system protein D (GspD) [Mucilaginibacter polytrichastri]
MDKAFTRLLLFVFFVLLAPVWSMAQQQNRIDQLKLRLDSLSATIPGLKEQVQISVAGASVKDYLNAIARANKLSFHVDPALDFKINTTFTNVTAANILILMAQQYNLDITSIGSIIVVKPYHDPKENVRPAAKILGVKYQSEQGLLSLELNNDSLMAVTRKVTQLSGRNIIVPAALQGKMVNAYIASAPFDMAIEKLAYGNELKVVKTNDNFYLFQPLEDGEQLYVNGDNHTAVRKTFKAQTAAGATGNTGLFSRVVNGQKLLSADATNAPILDMVKAASHECNKSYFIYSDIKGTISMHAADLSYDDFMDMLFKSTGYTYTQEKGVYMFGERGLEGLRTNKVIQLQNRSIDTVMAMIPADWKKGVEIKEFREQNTILLSGSKPQIAEIESFIKQIDLLVPMVLIEVTLIDFHNTRTVSTGIAAGVSDSVKTGGSVLPGLNFTMSANSVNSFLNKVSGVAHINLGHVVPSFYVSLQASENKDNVDIRSVPKLSTLNGHYATLSIGNSRWYKNTQANVIPSAATSQTILSNTYTETKADLKIDIKPIVSGDDQVTLNIKVNISDFTSIPTDGSPPPKSTSNFESIIRAHNEDTIVLGGIERTESNESGSGIPILSRIPILKYIFSSRSKTNAKVVTVVFIKPTIIR